MSSSYQPLPREELDVLFIPPQTYYNDGPFDPPSSDDEADAETLLDNDEPSRNGRRDEESYPVKGSPSKVNLFEGFPLLLIHSSDIPPCAISSSLSPPS